jgi:hypothetical protein
VYDERVVRDELRLGALGSVFAHDDDRVVGWMLDARRARRAQGARHDQILITVASSVNSSVPYRVTNSAIAAALMTASSIPMIGRAKAR